MTTQNMLESPYSTTPTATTIAQWDANKNLSANNHLNAYTTTATAAGTTTLTVSSTNAQFFTGTTTQTVVMPVASTLALGQQYYIVNQSTGVVTIQSSGGNTIIAMAANTVALLTCILTSGTTAASWYAEYEQSSLVLPLSVANGGTGDSSLTAYAVLCGGTTSTGNVQSIAGLGSSGQVLTSNGAGALPTFQTTGIAPTTLAFEGRITLTSGTPVTTSDVTAATTVYYTPYKGNQLSIYNGTNWTTITFTETSLSVPATTNKMYDLFAQNSGGSLALVAVAWSSDTSRTPATDLSLQDGVYCQTGTLTNLYLGSFRTTGVSGQTEDSVLKRYVWNYYNRVIREMSRVESTGTWTYSIAAFRQANGSTANQLDMVIGVSEDQVHAQVFASVFSSTSTFRSTTSGIGVDSTSVNSANLRMYVPCNNAVSAEEYALYDGFIAAGRHTLVWLEYGAGSDTQTWNGVSTWLQSGICGFLRG